MFEKNENRANKLSFSYNEEAWLRPPRLFVWMRCSKKQKRIHDFFSPSTLHTISDIPIPHIPVPDIPIPHIPIPNPIADPVPELTTDPIPNPIADPIPDSKTPNVSQTLLRVPFARVFQNGRSEYYLPTEVERADGPFYCVCCNETLVLKKGARRVRHFSHRSTHSACESEFRADHSSESVIHKHAKKLVAENLHRCTVQVNCSSCHVELRAISFYKDTHCAEVEKTVGQWRLDVGVQTVVDGKTCVAIEIFLTHRVGDFKRKGLHDMNVVVIETGATAAVAAILEASKTDDARAILTDDWDERLCQKCEETQKKARTLKCEGKCWHQVDGKCCEGAYQRTHASTVTCSCTLVKCSRIGCEQRHPLYRLRQWDMKCRPCWEGSPVSVRLSFGRHKGCFTTCPDLPPPYLYWLTGWGRDGTRTVDLVDHWVATNHPGVRQLARATFRFRRFCFYCHKKLSSQAQSWKTFHKKCYREL